MLECEVAVVFAIINILFFKQKTAYDVRMSDWSSDVCSSDLPAGVGPAVSAVDAGAATACVGTLAGRAHTARPGRAARGRGGLGLYRPAYRQIGRASCRERVCQYV